MIILRNGVHAGKPCSLQLLHAAWKALGSATSSGFGAGLPHLEEWVGAAAGVGGGVGAGQDQVGVTAPGQQLKPGTQGRSPFLRDSPLRLGQGPYLGPMDSLGRSLKV